MTALRWLMLCLCLFSFGPRAGEASPRSRPYTFHGMVVKVSDGDTVGVRSRGRYHILRLFGVDTPEKRQLDGPAATAFTRRFSFQKRATVKVVDRDRYGRLVSIVSIGGKSLNEALLAAGWAWHYKRYSKSKVYAALERKARRARRGIWRRRNPQAPWDWRRQQYRRRGARRHRRGRRYRRYRRYNRSRRYRRYQRHWRYHRHHPYQYGRRYGRDRFRGYERERKRQMPRRQATPRSRNQRGALFHGNVSSGVYHHKRCQHYQCRNCVRRFSSHKEARRAGFRPHRKCMHP